VRAWQKRTGTGGTDSKRPMPLMSLREKARAQGWISSIGRQKHRECGANRHQSPHLAVGTQLMVVRRERQDKKGSGGMQHRPSLCTAGIITGHRN
jgi:hypothetical protein